VDRVLPEAPYRQWVLTFPCYLRFLLAVDREFMNGMLRAFLRTVFAWQRLRGRQSGIPCGHPGSITFIQRFGGILNLNPHFHAILPDGLFVQGPDDRLVFRQLPPPTDADILRLAVKLARRLTRIAACKFEQVEDSFVEDDQVMVHASAAEALRRPDARPRSESESESFANFEKKPL